MVRIGEDLYDPDKSSGQSSPYFHSDEKRTVSKSQTSLNINGDDYNIIGLKQEHDTITLEPGCQFELSIKPEKTIQELKWTK